MNFIIIDNGSIHTDELKKLLADYNPITIKYGEINIIDIKPTDLIILSGGHGEPILWHDKQYSKEIELIKTHKGPIIGICLGFEMITHTFGSHLHLLAGRRRGFIEIKAIGKDNIIKENNEIKVFESHNWSVQKLSPPLVAVAKSVDGIEILRHKIRPIYGMQFHPEASDISGKMVFESIIRQLGVDI